MKSNFLVILFGLFSALPFLPVNVAADPIGQLIEGQWAEASGFDPFSSHRGLQVWLPEGTLIYRLDDSPHGLAEYRQVVTQHGHPLHIKIRIANRYLYREMTGGIPENSLFFTQSVLCPGSTNPIAWPNLRCLAAAPSGVGWTFTFMPPDEPSLADTHLQLVSSLDQATMETLELSESAISFRVRRDELDLLEKNGVIVRFDRDHPMTEFKYLGSNYFQCHSVESRTISKSDVTSSYVEASGGGGFNILNWLKTQFSAGVSFRETDEEIIVTKTVLQADKSSILQIWGLMIERSGGEATESPFFIEKTFDCQTDVPTTDPGDKITAVVVSFFDHQDSVDISYEYSEAENYFENSEEIFRFHNRRPIFFSVNRPADQAEVIRKIMDERPELNFNQAHFIFTHLNNACRRQVRETCAEN